jgi:2'-5' RNA ligase
MACSSNGADRINLFALVVYIPDPLATFLDHLRKELVPGCLPRAHVTILPPRPLAVDVSAALDAARSRVSGFSPFEIAAGDIEIFPGTDVIHISIREGERELREMHRALNNDALAFDEPFSYHPHITLAQDMAPGQVQPLSQLACQRWAAFRHSRRFRAERAVFVQSTVACTWVDLEEFRLAGVAVG